MSSILRSHIACEQCGSHDAGCEYEDGQFHCFSCGHHVYSSTSDYVAWRGVTIDTMRFFGVKTFFNKDGKPNYLRFPYSDVSAKIRSLEKKDFLSVGMKDCPVLFGQNKFSPGQSKSITITEGELDALSTFQMLGSQYPVVSVRSASSARKDCERARDFLNSFERIYLCFDNDIAGTDAARDVAMLFDLGKVYFVNLGRFKDPNEFLQNKAEKEFVSVWFSSKRYKPKGIISEWEDIEKILSKNDERPIAEYPFSKLQEMTYGIRSKEMVLFTALEKVGKTEIFRAIEYHLLKTTDYNIGIIHLEEEEKRTINGLVTYELRSPVHLPDSSYSNEDKFAAYKEVSKRSDRVHFYSHFGSEDPDVILDVVRALVTQCHCKFVFLDHISMVVSGSEEEKERQNLDYISTRLAMMTRELDFTLFMISHVNDAGQTRGSRMIAKNADLIINLSRDLENPDMEERNTTHLKIKGNRYSGKSGPSSDLFFDQKTYCLEEKVEPFICTTVFSR